MADAGDLRILRTRGGHRRIPVSEAVRYVRQADQRIISPERLGLQEVPAEAATESTDAAMLSALEAGEADTVFGLMQWLYASGQSVAELCDGPLAFAMAQIGSRWPHDKRAIFVEHRATMLCVRALNQLRLSVPQPAADAPIAVGAAMSSDTYLLPTLAASLVLYESGLNETNLGPNTPLDVLADAVAELQPELVWLSIGQPPRSQSQLAEVLRLAEVASEKKASFVVGGRYTEELASIQMDSSGQPRWTHCDSMGDLQEIAANCLFVGRC